MGTDKMKGPCDVLTLCVVCGCCKYIGPISVQVNLSSVVFWYRHYCQGHIERRGHAMHTSTEILVVT